MKDLFDGYNKDSRPVFNKSKAVNVELDVAYSQLVDLVILQCYFLFVILFNFHRWLQKGGHFINYENTHCFLDCFFYASRGRVVEITKFAPNRDTLIALKGLKNDLCKIVLMASRGLVFLYVGSLKGVINDILKLRNWRKLTMSNCVSQRELITTIFFVYIISL